MSKKNENFEALRDAIIIRRKTTNVLRVLALQAQKRLEKLEKTLADTAAEEELVSAREALREERFNLWLI